MRHNPTLWSALCVLGFLLLGSPLAAQQKPPEQSDEEKAREAEMFGPSDDEEEEEESSGDSRDEDIFGGSRDDELLGGDGASDTESRLSAKMDEVEDLLAIGGRLFLQFNWFTQEEGDVLEFPFSSPNLLDVYFDARPNDRIRAYVRGRLTHDFTVTEGEQDTFGRVASQDRVSLDQLWLNFDMGRAVFVTVGRQPIRWGSGRFWNPTDFLNQQVRDPLAVFDTRLGVSLLKLHVPIESLAWNFYAVALLERAGSPKEVGGALRLEMVAGDAEVSVSLAGRKDEPVSLGADVSSALWLFDVRVEAAVFHGVKTPFFEGDLNLSLEDLAIPTQFSREDEFIPQVVAGAEIQIDYADDDSFFVGGEYFFNDAGYDSAELYPWLLFQGAFTPLFLGRHYASLYTLIPSPGTWDDTSFVLSLLSNLSDRSVLARFDYRVRVLTQMSFNAFATLHTGKVGEFRFGLEVPGVPGVPGLEEGLSVAPQLIDVGAGLSVSF